MDSIQSDSTVVESKPKTKKVFVDKKYYCPKCHYNAHVPDWLKNTNVSVGGKINITCGNQILNKKIKITGKMSNSFKICDGIVHPQFKEVPIEEVKENKPKIKNNEPTEKEELVAVI